MNLQKIFSSGFGTLEGLGKESFALIILVTGAVFRCKGLIDGAQFVDLIKNVGMAYLAGHTINSTWGNNSSIPDGEVQADDPDHP